MSRPQFRLRARPWEITTVIADLVYSGVWGKSLFEYELLSHGGLPAKYHIENALGVDSHLAAHPSLVEVLDEAADRIRATFGNVQLFLGAMPTHGSDEEPSLLVKIKPPEGMSTEDALDRLDSFDDEWWLEQPADIGRELIITLG